MEEKQFDVIVIGAGPVGLYTGFYCGLRKLKTLIVDSLDTIGGQLVSLYPEKVIHDLPGFVGISAAGFIDHLDQQLNSLGETVQRRLGFSVEHIHQEENGLYVVSSSQTALYCRTIILAMGNGAFVPRRLSIEAEEHYTNIHYALPSMKDFRDKDVIVFGGGDSAIDWSLMLEDTAKSVTLVHRREAFRAKPAMMDRLVKSSVRVLAPYLLRVLQGQAETVESIVLEQSKTKETIAVPCEEILVCYGATTQFKGLQSWGIELNESKVKIDQQSRTSRKGIFACGDICIYDQREIQIVSGLSEGLMASASAYNYLYPERQSRQVR